jgi:metacaspase-1
MSWAFINALKKNPQQSYVQLLNSIRDELATKYTQKPQLSCSHPLSKPSPLTLSTARLTVILKTPTSSS